MRGGEGDGGRPNPLAVRGGEGDVRVGQSS